MLGFPKTKAITRPTSIYVKKSIWLSGTFWLDFYEHLETMISLSGIIHIYQKCSWKNVESNFVRYLFGVLSNIEYSEYKKCNKLSSIDKK